MLSKGISVVIPVYKSAQCIRELTNRLFSVLSQSGDPFEVIFVNDKSPDNSWDIIAQLSREKSNIAGINLMYNSGQHCALLAGIRYAHYDTIVTMDDDLQHPPEEIPKLLNQLSQGYDVVYGIPRVLPHGTFRNFSSKFIKLCLSITMNSNIAQQVSAFRAFRASLKNVFADFRSPCPCIDVLLTWGTRNFTSVQVEHEPRKCGKSNYSFLKLIIHTLNMATGYSTLPLRLASLLGFFFTFMGLLVLLYVMGRYFISGNPVAGFPFLASIIAIFSGAQLFVFGIFGEYLARMYVRIMDRPGYIIQEIKDNRNLSHS